MSSSIVARATAGAGHLWGPCGRVAGTALYSQLGGTDLAPAVACCAASQAEITPCAGKAEAVADLLAHRPVVYSGFAAVEIREAGAHLRLRTQWQWANQYRGKRVRHDRKAL
jgi:hypothetical protein